jgi:hypothetical protein
MELEGLFSWQSYAFATFPPRLKPNLAVVARQMAPAVHDYCY